MPRIDGGRGMRLENTVEMRGFLEEKLFVDDSHLFAGGRFRLRFGGEPV
jgi:hypothetical protein